MNYILVDKGVVSLNGFGDVTVDTSELAAHGVSVVAYTANSYWIEKNPFNGREQDEEIKAIADGILDYAKREEDRQTKPLTGDAALQAEREGMIVSAFQAKAALLLNGHLQRVEDYMATSADEVTKLAWTTAQEFRRNSPTVNSIATLLNLTETEIDDLFRQAATIEA